MAKTNQTYPPQLCSFRTLDYLSTLAAFASDEDFRLYVTIPAVVMSPLITFSNGVVLMAIFIRCSQTPALSLMCCLLCSDTLMGLVFLPLYAVWTKNNYALNSCVITGCLLFFGWFLSFISFMTIVAVSGDRFVALFYPFKYKSIVTFTRTIKLILMIWTFSAIQSTMSLFHNFVVPRYIFLGCLLSFGLFVLIFTYARIFKLVRHHQRQINSQQIHNDNTHQKKLAITMAYVIAVTLLCYTPFGISLAFYVIQGQFNKTSLQFFHLSELLFCCSSLCNPVIYCMRNLEIRTAVLSLIRNITTKLFRINGTVENQQDHHESTVTQCTQKKDSNLAQSMAELNTKF